jgi:hypothetical protein
MPLGHRGSEGFHLELQLTVLLSKPRGHTCSLLHPVLCGVLIPPSYVALFVSLVALAKSLLTLMANEVKLGLEPLRGP